MIIKRKRLKIEMREDGPFQQEGFDLMAAVFDVHNENGGGAGRRGLSGEP